MKRLLNLLIVLISMLGVSAVQADVINWTVDGQFSDGTFISGNFSIDNALYQYVSFDVATQQSGSFAGHHYYLDDIFVNRPNAVALRTPVVSPDAFIDDLLVRFFQNMFLLGFDTIVIGDITEVSSNPNDSFAPLTRFGESVSFTSDHNPNDVPEPASITLFGCGLIAFFSLRRRN